jgi:hypothetical protein
VVSGTKGAEGSERSRRLELLNFCEAALWMAKTTDGHPRFAFSH